MTARELSKTAVSAGFVALAAASNYLYATVACTNAQADHIKQQCMTKKHMTFNGNCWVTNSGHIKGYCCTSHNILGNCVITTY
jgi:hypothetical protein